MKADATLSVPGHLGKRSAGLIKRCVVRVLACIGVLMLAGCLETQVPLVTSQNALATSPIADGLYCEVKFTFIPGKNRIPVDVVVAERSQERCIALEWVDAARGWSTSIQSLPTDEDGVSVRARKLGTGNDPFGLNNFLMVQVGGEPRQLAVGGRIVSVDPAHLFSVYSGQDMFALIELGQPVNEMQASAGKSGIRLTQTGAVTSIGSVAALGNAQADAVGRWLAEEITRTVYAADLPGVGSTGPIRVFARMQTPYKSPDQFRESVQELFEKMLFEVGVLNQYMKLGLPSARMNPELLDLKRAMEPVKQALDGGTDKFHQIKIQASHCMGIMTASLAVTRDFSEKLAQVRHAEPIEYRAIINDEISEVQKMIQRLLNEMLGTRKILEEILAAVSANRSDATQDQQAEQAYESGLTVARPAKWQGVSRKPGEVVAEIDGLLANYRAALQCLETLRRQM